MVENIHWLGHDTFKITGEKTVYTDPFKVKAKDTADVILITHEHFDHCNPDDVKKLLGPNTVVVATPDCAGKLKGATVKTVKPGDKLTVNGVDIEVVPSYNTGKKFHVKGQNWVGYVFTVNGRRIYLAGDTDRIPEMKTLGAIDVALLPVSGTYVMTADEAADAALDINPKVAIPMHYGAVVGSDADAKRFAEKLKGKVHVEILTQE